jgi:hypothetical protein
MPMDKETLQAVRAAAEEAMRLNGTKIAEKHAQQTQDSGDRVMDITPTWEGCLPLLLETHSGEWCAENKKDAHENLVRMARAADAHVAEQKTTKAKTGEPLKRWIATITYDHGDRTFLGTEREIDELSELHDLVEHGPNFYSIAKIEIVINPALDRKTMLGAA